MICDKAFTQSYEQKALKFVIARIDTFLSKDDINRIKEIRIQKSLLKYNLMLENRKKILDILDRHSSLFENNQKNHEVTLVNYKINSNVKKEGKGILIDNVNEEYEINCDFALISIFQRVKIDSLNYVYLAISFCNNRTIAVLVKFGLNGNIEDYNWVGSVS